jgi:YD repeat-containing protein
LPGPRVSLPNRLTERSNTCRASASGAGTTYTYDPNGNLHTKVEGSDTWAYEWNTENRLTRVTKNSVEQARIAYDPLGRRVEKVAGGVTTSYSYDGVAILREARGATVVKYIHGRGIDDPLGIDDGTALSYYQADGLGSIAGLVDPDGLQSYDPNSAWGGMCMQACSVLLPPVPAAPPGVSINWNIKT